MFKKLLAIIAAALITFGCATMKPNGYKDFADLYPEFAAQQMVPHLGDYIIVNENVPEYRKFHAINIGEATHKEHGHWIIFVDTTIDGNLDGAPDGALFFVKWPKEMVDLYGMPFYPRFVPEHQLDSFMNDILTYANELGLTLEDVIVRPGKINYPKNWQEVERELNKAFDNNAAEF